MDKPNDQSVKNELISRQTPIAIFRSEFSKMELEIKKLLPVHVPIEKFTRIVLTAVQNDKALLNADRSTLFSSCLKAASDGLLPDGREAVLLPFNINNVLTATYLPMIGGILKKIRNSGELKSIMSQVVYEKDEFTFWIDESGEHLLHKPTLDSSRGEITHAYAIAKTKTDGTYIEVMTKTDIDFIRNFSRAKKSGPWITCYSEMARKTVLRRLSKMLPMSTDLEELIRRGEDQEFDFEKPKEDVMPKEIGSPIQDSIETIKDKL